MQIYEEGVPKVRTPYGDLISFKRIMIKGIAQAKVTKLQVTFTEFNLVFSEKRNWVIVSNHKVTLNLYILYIYYNIYIIYINS